MESSQKHQTAGSSGSESQIGGFLPFLAIVIPFGLLVLVIEQWQIETVAVSRVMQLSFVGFIVHHFLPLRFRMGFFVMLSLLATIVVAGNMGPKTWVAGFTGVISLNDFFYHFLPGTVVIVVGLCLIGICHLPIPILIRILLLVAAGTALSLIRANRDWFPDVSGAWIILGAMFALRLLVYMYDLKNGTVPFAPMKSLAYFFMIPNVCFPLFPVVDYKTFVSTYFNEHWSRIYLSGLRWISRGVVQLLLYQAVYQFAPLDIATLDSALGVAGFILSTYLLYLHVSGQFHIIVGLLHMFGFNLPETHHLYYLASSFTDFWRRINIYWKDFVMKLFFYPVFFRLRKLGMQTAMVLATLATFFATWALHSWQVFWIRGSFLFTWQDISFWLILAILVLVNVLYESKQGRARTLTKARITMRDRFMVGLRTTGTFTVLCLLWTLWSIQSGDEIRTLADAASQPSLVEIAIVMTFLVGIGIAGMIWGHSSREWSEGKKTVEKIDGPVYWRSIGLVSASAACLLAAPTILPRSFPETNRVVARLRQDLLNAGDLRTQRRGYYEELEHERSQGWGTRIPQKPKGWDAGREIFYRNRSDLMMVEIVPSISTVLAGAPVTTNSLGLRDREYEVAKPPQTHRIVLLGSSHDQGTGVKDGETYENLLEDEWNSENPTGKYARHEILNLSVGGHSVLQRLWHLEQRGLTFDPDVVVFSFNAADRQFVVQHLTQCLIKGVELPADYRDFLEGIFRKSGVHAKMPELMIERRLGPHVSAVYEWLFHRLALICKEQKVMPIIIYRPSPLDPQNLEPKDREEVIQLARNEALDFIDLSPAFDSIQNRNKLILAQWDHHTTGWGHQLLMKTLKTRLSPLLFPESEEPRVSPES